MVLSHDDNHSGVGFKGIVSAPPTRKQQACARADQVQEALGIHFIMESFPTSIASIVVVVDTTHTTGAIVMGAIVSDAEVAQEAAQGPRFGS